MMPSNAKDPVRSFVTGSSRDVCRSRETCQFDKTVVLDTPERLVRAWKWGMAIARTPLVQIMKVFGRGFGRRLEGFTLS